MDWPFGFFVHTMPLFGIAATIFWIWLMIHCLKNTQLGNWKIPWFLFIIFSQGLGAVIYFFIYVLPGSGLSRWFTGQFQSSQSSTPYYRPSSRQPPQQPVYPSKESYTYQPSNQQGYQSYNAGYQAQTSQYPSYPPVPSVPSTMPQEEQLYPSYDYEQPQTMYPELPPQQQ